MVGVSSVTTRVVYPLALARLRSETVTSSVRGLIVVRSASDILLHTERLTSKFDTSVVLSRWILQ